MGVRLARLLAIPGLDEQLDEVAKLAFDQATGGSFACDGGGCAMYELVGRLRMFEILQDRIPSDGQITRALWPLLTVGRNDEQAIQALRDEVRQVTMANDMGHFAEPGRLAKFVRGED